MSLIIFSIGSPYAFDDGDSGGGYDIAWSWTIYLAIDTTKEEAIEAAKRHVQNKKVDPRIEEYFKRILDEQSGLQVQCFPQDDFEKTFVPGKYHRVVLHEVPPDVKFSGSPDAVPKPNESIWI